MCIYVSTVAWCLNSLSTKLAFVLVASALTSTYRDYLIPALLVKSQKYSN